MVEQLSKKPPSSAEPGAYQTRLHEEYPFGVLAEGTHPALQSDAFKELINKLSWALGSTYRIQYGSVHNPVRKYAQRMAKRVLADHGYPDKIAKSVDNPDR